MTATSNLVCINFDTEDVIRKAAKRKAAKRKAAERKVCFIDTIN